MRGGAGTGLVGDPETVVHAGVCGLGIETFIFSGYLHLEEAYRFAELEESALMRVLQLEDDFFDQPLGDLSFLRTVHQVAWAI